jgi:hypothetical protein
MLSLLKYSQNKDSDSYCFADAFLSRLRLVKCRARKGQRSTTYDMKARLIVVISIVTQRDMSDDFTSVYTWHIARSGKQHNILCSSNLCSTRFNLVCHTRHESLYTPHLKGLKAVWADSETVSIRHVDCSWIGEIKNTPFRIMFSNIFHARI